MTDTLRPSADLVVSAGEADDDHPAKRERLLGLLGRHGVETLLLTSQPALAWYLEGARIHVSLAAPPIVAVRVSADGDELLLTDNELDRLVAEEVPGWVTPRPVPWHTPITGGPDDLPEAAVDAELRALRAPLLPSETGRFARLGADVAALLTDVLGAVDPAETERGLAATLAAGVVALGAEPLVVLVGGESRAAHRHPLPTSAPLGRRAMVVLCARRHGLVINVSRFVAFGEPSAAERDTDARILGVEAEFFAALAPGRTLGEVFALGCAGYARHGFDPQEWRRHHQGGVAGYNGRDPRAVPGSPDLVGHGQAFAWNPTALGCKVEDTVLFTADGIATLTVDSRWPTVSVADRARPAVLVR